MYIIIIMSATDVGWAPRGGVKDNKEENDALAWKGVAIATLSVEQETSAELEIGPAQRRLDTITCNKI